MLPAPSYSHLSLPHSLLIQESGLHQSELCLILRWITLCFVPFNFAAFLLLNLQGHPILLVPYLNLPCTDVPHNFVSAAESSLLELSPVSEPKSLNKNIRVWLVPGQITDKDFIKVSSNLSSCSSITCAISVLHSCSHHFLILFLLFEIDFFNVESGNHRME